MNNRTERQKNEDRKLIIRRIEQILELTLLGGAYYLIYAYNYRPGYYIYALLGRGKYILIFLYLVILIAMMLETEGFQFGYLKMLEVTISQWTAIVITNLVTYLQLCLMANFVVKPMPMILLTLLDLPLSFGCVLLYTFYYHHVRIPYNMLMISDGSESGIALRSKMESRSDRYRITRTVRYDLDWDQLRELILGYDAVLLGDIPEAEQSRLLIFCYANQIRTYLSPTISDVIKDGAGEINLFDTPLKLIKGLGISLGNRAMKRFMDIVLSVLALVFLSPLFLLIAVLIKAEDHGPVFFKQKRVTLHGREFEILKFRSMIPDAEAEGKAMPALQNDQRITKTGRVIRKYRLDELPQFINILKGEMSLVGPRPERVEHVRKYAAVLPEWHLREAVRGGLTGYAQVYGKYNTTASDKLKLDLMYIENYSFLLDFKLILITIRALFQKESTEGFDEEESMKIGEEQPETEHEGRAPEGEQGQDGLSTDHDPDRDKEQ